MLKGGVEAALRQEQHMVGLTMNDHTHFEMQDVHILETTSIGWVLGTRNWVTAVVEESYGSAHIQTPLACSVVFECCSMLGRPQDYRAGGLHRKVHCYMQEDCTVEIEAELATGFVHTVLGCR